MAADAAWGAGEGWVMKCLVNKAQVLHRSSIPNPKSKNPKFSKIQNFLGIDMTSQVENPTPDFMCQATVQTQSIELPSVCVYRVYLQHN